MLFNYDLFELGTIAFIISGIVLYSYSKSAATTNNESLVNTKSSLDTIELQATNLPESNLQYVDANIQTANINIEASVQATTTYVNTGMQTSARMWLESIRNWINEILGTPNNPSIVEGYVDVGIQTNGPSSWETVKQWFFLSM